MRSLFGLVFVMSVIILGDSDTVLAKQCGPIERDAIKVHVWKIMFIGTNIEVLGVEEPVVAPFENYVEAGDSWPEKTTVYHVTYHYREFGRVRSHNSTLGVTINKFTCVPKQVRSCRFAKDGTVSCLD